MGIGWQQLLIILIIVILLFGTSKLRNLGGDLGSAFKNFKKAVKDGDNDDTEKKPLEKETPSQTIDGEVTQKSTSSEKE